MSGAHEALVKRLAVKACEPHIPTESEVNYIRGILAEIARAAQEWPTEEMTDAWDLPGYWGTEDHLNDVWTSMLHASPLMPQAKSAAPAA